MLGAHGRAGGESGGPAAAADLHVSQPGLSSQIMSLERVPQPPVQRPLCVYTRTRPDPITAAFIDAIADEVTANPGPLAQPRLTSPKE